MLSIIISSYQPHFFQQLSENIAETCGIEYEIVKIENHGIKGICEAYNEGAAKAVFDNLLFLHEDLIFYTQNWGQKLIAHLADEKIGIVGIAGSDYVPVVPCGWFIKNDKHQFTHLIQNNKEGNCAHLLSSVSQIRHKVFGVDGVFMAMTKRKFLECRFDEKIKVYHGYDLDISLNMANKYDNVVVSDILLEHYSMGGADKNFFDTNIYIRKKYKTRYQQEIINEIEIERFENFVYSYFRFHGINVKVAMKSLRYLPVGKIAMKDYKKIFLNYIKYFRFKGYYHSKFGY